MTGSTWRAVSFVGIAVVIAMLVFLALPDDVRTRWTDALETASPFRLQSHTSPTGGDARTGPSAGDPSGAKRDDTREAARQTPVEALPEVRPDGRPRETSPSSDKAEQAPSLDIVRIEPNGDSVIAGRTQPNAAVELLRDNKPIARTTADSGGNFAIVPPTLPTGNSEISYRSVAPDGRTTAGKESVAVVIAQNRSTKPLVAVSTPDKPTEVLSQPDAPVDGQQTAQNPDAKSPQQMSALSTEPGKPETQKPELQRSEPARSGTSTVKPSKPGAAPVQIVSIDAQEGGRLDVSVVGVPGATLRLYLNETMVASGQVGPDGKLAFTVGKGMRAGAYQVRIDQVEGGTGKVANRAQVAFSFPESAAAPVRSAQNEASAPSKAERPPTAAGRPVTSTPEPEPRATQQGSATADGTTSPKAVLAERSNGGATPTPQGSEASARTGTAGRTTERADSAPPASTAPGLGIAQRSQSADRRPSDDTARLPGTNAAQQPGVASSTLSASQRAPSDPATVPPTGQAGAVFVAEIATAKITRGDNLWQISRRSYGSGLRYTVIFDANKEQIRDPNLIYPGQIFVLPKDEDASKRG